MLQVRLVPQFWLPIQIGNLLHSLATGSITWSTARVWFAAVEMVAIRDAAGRVRCLRRDKRQVEPEYRRTELSKLTGLSARAIGKSVNSLRQTGLAILTTRAIEIVNHSMPEAGETIQVISGGRSPRGVVRCSRASHFNPLGQRGAHRRSAGWAKSSSRWFAPEDRQRPY